MLIDFGNVRKGLAKGIYHEALQPAPKATTPFIFGVPPPIGPLEFFRVTRDQMNMRDGSPIQCQMMDLALRYERATDRFADIHVPQISFGTQRTMRHHNDHSPLH